MCPSGMCPCWSASQWAARRRPRVATCRLAVVPARAPPNSHLACVLVLVGVHADGSKELVALQDGYREFGESWADLLRDCARQSMHAPILAVGDGALGFWKILVEVKPTRCSGSDPPPWP